MKLTLKITLLVFIVIFGSGCTTGYWIDRGRDAKDVFNLNLGLGAGAKARLGPLHIGAIYSEDIVGLRGGDFFWDPLGNFDCHAILIGCDKFNLRRGMPDRDKRYFTIQSLVTFPEVAAGEGTRIGSAAYYTQVDCVVGLGPTVRVGFNPGELVDLILGFVGVDLYDDDLERRKEREIEQTGRPSGLP